MPGQNTTNTRSVPARLAAMLVFLAGFLVLPSIAQDEGGDISDPEAMRAELERVQAAIVLNEERTEQMRAEIDTMDGDRAQQNAALIAAAQRVKAAEVEVETVEQRLTEIVTQENEIRGRLDGADENVTKLLAALQRISKSPPPALIVDPADAVGSARGALLLSSILPQLRERADAVSTDLASLVDIRRVAQTEKDSLRANLAILFEEQLRTATLIEARRQGIVKVGSQLDAEEIRAQELAAEAQSLTELIDTMRASIVAAPVATAPIDPEGTNLDREAILTALAVTDRSEPAIPFAAARGFLSLPAAGVAVNSFGTDDGLGGVNHGLSIVTRAEAQVVAPADGWVIYKGPYLNYGEIIILNPGQGYSILLAGMDTTNVELDQFVRMGEPVGMMGSRNLGLDLAGGAGVSRPTLYIELREQDTPLNPANWWATDENRTQSG